MSALQRFFPLGAAGGGGPLSVTISPASISIYVPFYEDPLQGGATAMPVGGGGTYGYLWEQIAGPGGATLGPSANAKSVTFTSINLSGGPVENVSTWQVTVTDGVNTATATIEVRFGHGVPSP